MTKVHIALFVTVLLCKVGVLYSQSSECFLYGEVWLKNGEKVKGQIRWGNEELMWDDMFFGTKEGAPFGINEQVKKQIDKSKNSVFDHFNLGFMQLWENRGQNTRYTFKCQFGDIDKIQAISDTKARIIFKNGQRIAISKSSENDIGSAINVFSFAGVRQRINWRQIDKIQFLPFPEGRYSQLGTPIYGKVETTNGTYEGFIAWNLQKRVSTDKLKGLQKEEKVNVAFGRIKKIEVEGDGALVTMKTGEKIFLNDHRDVSRRSKGILVKQKNFGHVLIHWEELIAAEFLKAPEHPMYYRDFFITHYIQGTVTDKKGNTFLGRVVYDLDEYLTLEVLDGSHNNMEYFIPFKHIGSIKKQNFNYVKVCLKNGEELLLSGHADVTSENQGVIIDTYNRKNIYVSWRNIRVLNFK
ncbi:MAG: hypothetical protein AAGI07_03425 [Bacteroidota bacterium]